MNNLDLLEGAYLRDDVPEFRAGDTVKVHVRVVEGGRERVQMFEGVVIARNGSGLRESFTVRKVSFGVGSWSKSLLVFGDDLPWVDGATWLGQDPSARGLYLPTQRAPSVHPALLLRAIRQRGVQGPVAILPGDGTLVPLGEARPIDADRLRAWLG